MSEHSNDQLAIEDLPTLEDIDWVEMDRNLIVRDVMRNCIFSFVILIVVGILGITFLTVNVPVLSLLGILAFCIGFGLIILLILWPRMEFPHRGYALRELDVAHKHGLVTRYLATAPFSRVQHVSVSQGVLDRMFKVSTIQIFTAGGVSSIRGFNLEDAHSLREHILERVAEISAIDFEELTDENEQFSPL